MPDVENAVVALADELVEVTMAAEPLGATLIGLPGHDHELADPSEESEQRQRGKLRDIAARADKLGKTAAGETDRVTAAVTAQIARARIDEIESRQIEYTITDIFVGPAASLLSFLPMIVLPDAERGQAYLTRLRALPDHLAATTRRHRDGADQGRVPVRRLVDSAVAHLDRYLAKPDADPLLRPSLDDPAFNAERAKIVTDIVRPAFAEYRAALVEDLAPRGRADERPGLCWLPGGDDAYTALSRKHTTTDRLPDELHQTGLDLIEQLRAEYAEVGGALFGVSDQVAVFHRLTTDPAMRWNDGDELIAAAKEAIERAEAEAPKWFGTLPSQRCLVEPVPADEAPGAPAAYYMAPSLDGLRPGVYYANTDRAHERDRFLAEVTAFHEAVPGHHFQLTIANELTGLPVLRRIADFNAYAEGWGLYTERLAQEMGLYSGDVARIGMLAMDSLRASRLVVDTGIHAKGWTREQAVRFMRDNTPLSALEIGNEVDRYTAYPGQALSYMVGRLEIQRIRAATEQRLAERFDIRAFHDKVLGGGALPLTVLDQVMADWTG